MSPCLLAFRLLSASPPFDPDFDHSPYLAGVLAHPNVSAAVIRVLGCEVNQIDITWAATGLQADAAIDGGTRGDYDAALLRLTGHRTGASEKRTLASGIEDYAWIELRRSNSFSGINRQPGAGL